jgi:hypothetical protein
MMERLQGLQGLQGQFPTLRGKKQLQTIPLQHAKPGGTAGNDPANPANPATDLEAEERQAIQNEAELATRQTIPQAQMLAGLLRAARRQW